MLRTVVTAFTVAAVVYAVCTKRPTGRFLNVPYDFRMPTMDRLRRRLWNPDDQRVFTPSFFGVGWSLNLYQVRRKLRESPPSDGQSELPGDPEG